MKIFIDAGSNGGLIPTEFKKLKIIDDAFKVISFEPNIKFRGLYPHIEKAVWISDCKLTFSTGDNDFRSTIVAESEHWEQESNPQFYDVEGIDFSKWLRETITPDDYVVLKMDIEGAEFEVLEKMIREETHKLINQYFVEFHEWCMSGDGYAERKDAIVNALDNLTEWR